MEAVRQLENVSEEAETEEVPLRGRLPRHHDDQIVVSVVEKQQNKVDLPAFSPSKEIEVHSPLNINDGTTSTKDTDQAYFEGKSIEELRELYLETLYNEKQGPHEFYCPNCKVCITKVLVYDRDPLPEPIRCTSCFSFLIPGWLFSKPPTSVTKPISEQPALLTTEHRSLNKWEILKSIVYGGLAESITSLGIVTSAASGHASTLSIVALAVANLLGGLFVISQNLWDLKYDRSKVSTSDDTEQQAVGTVDRYEEVLGKKEHFILHAFLAILSFLVFGLVPPVVYGFTFRESDDRYLKLAAVAAASLLIVTLLSLAKASTQEQPKYIKTVTYYVVVGFGVSGASYLAGELINRLLEKLKWFEPTQPAFTLPLAEMVTGKSAW